MISSRQNSLHGFETLFELPVFDLFQIQKRSGKGEGGGGGGGRGKKGREGREEEEEGGGEERGRRGCSKVFAAYLHVTGLIY